MLDFMEAYEEGRKKAEALLAQQMDIDYVIGYMQSELASVKIDCIVRRCQEPGLAKKGEHTIAIGRGKHHGEVPIVGKLRFLHGCGFPRFVSFDKEEVHCKNKRGFEKALKAMLRNETVAVKILRGA